jgi:glyoxylase-like metal-dependent hydrolase (beta-lactamase superfamily II)
MILDSFPVGPLGANCTILGDEKSGEALVFDPGDEARRIYQRLESHKLAAKQILLTHAHLDHVGAAAALKKLTGAPIYLNENDLPLLEAAPQQAAWMGMAPPAIEPPDFFLTHGQNVGTDALPVTVLFTPGHTQGGVCFYLVREELLIAGDTLFAGSVGRTDLPGGNSAQLLESIRTQLLPLPDATRVICGHGPTTSIGRERRQNPYLSGTIFNF